MLGEPLAEGLRVERLDTKTEMIEISPFLAGRCASRGTELAVDRHEIQKRTPRAQLHQAECLLTALDGASERIAVEAKHPVQVDDSENEMIDLAYAHHAAGSDLAFYFRASNSSIGFPEGSSQSTWRPPGP